MTKKREIDVQINELAKKLAQDKSLAEGLSQVSDIIDDLEDNNQHARWPYVDANPIAGTAWQD